MRRELEPWLTGRTVEGVDLLAPIGPKYRGLEHAVGRSIEGVNRRGKFLLLPLSGGLELIAHLGMTGVIAGKAPADDKHVRVKLQLSGVGPNTLYFIDARRFGRFLVVGSGEYDGLPTLAALGPEPLSDEFTAELLATGLARSRVAIKTYLLSQRPVAGVGNIYADEALWRARIHPLTPAAEVSAEQVRELHAAVRAVLHAAIEANGTTLNDYRTVSGGLGGYVERLDVYGQAGAACPRCGAELQRAVVAGRGTTYCPDCQRRGARRNEAR